MVKKLYTQEERAYVKGHFGYSDSAKSYNYFNHVGYVDSEKTYVTLNISPSYNSMVLS
jgi:hypothetical protein